jgi:multiple sugar transport system permease protein
MKTPGREAKNRWTALLFLAPNFLGFCLFGLVPLALSLAGSFTTWSLRPSVPLQFVGLTNYIELFRDRNFYFYLYNTGYLMLAMPVSVSGALMLAVWLNQQLRFKKSRRQTGLAVTAAVVALAAAGLLCVTGSPNLAYITLALGLISALGFQFGSVSYRTFFYLPHFTAGAATIILWSQLYNPNFGLINQGLRNAFDFFGLD